MVTVASSSGFRYCYGGAVASVVSMSMLVTVVVVVMATDGGGSSYGDGGS